MNGRFLTMKTGARRLIPAVLVAAALLGAPAPASAQDGYAIAAVVNDEVISVYDIRARMQLLLAVSNIEDTPENHQRLQPQVLRQLIDERLQIQEAQRLNLTVTDEELRQAVATLERQNNLPPGGLEARLTSEGVPLSSLMAQVRGNLAWGKVIRRQIRPQVEIGEEEIDEQLEQLRARGGGAEYQVSEIFIPADATADESSALETAQRVAQQARAGTPFAALAQQFSQAPTAATGGDLGRVQEGQLDRRLDAALTEMSPGEVSQPVRVENGYYILYLRDRRQLGAPPPAQAARGDVTVALRRLFLPLPANASQGEIQSQGQLASTASETVQGCADMERLAVELGAQGQADVGRIRLSELPQALRQVVEPLAVGKASPPLRLDNGFLVLMVCDRTEGAAPARPQPAASEAALPSREQVGQSLGMQRIDMLARRYMRDLRRAAFVDVRT